MLAPVGLVTEPELATLDKTFWHGADPFLGACLEF
jgi:hypothetical protein